MCMRVCVAVVCRHHTATVVISSKWTTGGGYIHLSTLPIKTVQTLLMSWSLSLWQARCSTWLQRSSIRAPGGMELRPTSGP